MSSFKNYNSRFYQLLESELGNVKPLINEGISPQQNQIVVAFQGCGNVGSLILTLGEKDENGIYESINKMHSWNSISNALLFRI